MQRKAGQDRGACDVYAGGAKAGEGGRWDPCQARPQGTVGLGVFVGGLGLFFLLSSCLWKQNQVEEGGYSDIKNAAVRTRPDAGHWSTKEQESRTTRKRRRTEGLDKKYAGACKKGARGGIQGLIAGQLPDCSLGTKPTSSHSSSRPPSLPPSHRATSTAHESRRPVGPHNCVDA